MLVAFRVRADVPRESHIAFLEACLAGGSDDIVVIREGEDAPGVRLDPIKEIARLKRRPRRAASVCYLVTSDLGSRLRGRFGREIVAEPTRSVADRGRPVERFPGLLQADTATSPVLASVETASLNLDPALIATLARSGLHTLEAIAREPALNLIRMLGGNRHHLQQLSLVLIEAVGIAFAHLSDPGVLPETPLGPVLPDADDRALRQMSIASSPFPTPLTRTLSRLGYDTLSDVAQTPLEVWREVYKLTPATIALMSAEIHLALHHLRGRPVPAAGHDDSLKAFLDRHLLADLSGQVPVPDSVTDGMPDSLAVDVYAVTPVFAETLALLHEPVGEAAGRPVWYRIDTGPLDADPSLITLARLCAATLALKDAGGHDLAGAPRGTAH